jgi:predicted kinase
MHTSTERQAEEPDPSKQCYLITGPPGAGKSTLATTVVKRLEARRRLKGDVKFLQYFVSRNYQDTTETNKFFPAILEQLVEYAPAARVIHNRLDSIAEAKTAGQLMGEALKNLAAHYQGSMIVLVVDAFEELKERSGSDRVPSILVDLMRSLPLNIKVIITSREETEILDEVLKIPEVVELHNLKTDDSHDDVSKYIEHRLRSIGKSSEVLKGWPTDVQINELSCQANGLFHYAATAISWIEGKFMDDRGRWKMGLKREWGDNALRRVTNLEVGQLYDLYKGILDDITYGDEDLECGSSKKEIQDAQCIMECLIHSHTVLSVGNIGRLLKITNPLPFFQQLRMVLVVGTNSVDLNSIPQMHKSFRDYITHWPAPQIGQVLPCNANLMLTSQCLTALSDSSTAEDVLLYAKAYWSSHFNASMEKGDNSKEKMELLLEIMTNTVTMTRIGQVLSEIPYGGMSECKDIIRGGWHMLEKVDNKGAVIEGMDILLHAIKVNV